MKEKDKFITYWSARREALSDLTLFNLFSLLCSFCSSRWLDSQPRLCRGPLPEGGTGPTVPEGPCTWWVLPKILLGEQEHQPSNFQATGWRRQQGPHLGRTVDPGTQLVRLHEPLCPVPAWTHVSSTPPLTEAPVPSETTAPLLRVHLYFLL